MIEIGKDGRILSTNEQSLKIFGFRHDELVGRNIIGTILPSRDAASNLAMVSKIFNAKPNSTSVMENTCKDGRRIWIKWVNEAINGEDGSVVRRRCRGVMLTGGSGDELKQLIESFEVMRESLKASMVKVSEAAITVADYAETLGSSAEELTSSASQVSHSIQQISTTMQSQAKSVNEITLMTKKASEAAASGKKQGDEMEADARHAGESAKTVIKLGEIAMSSLENIKRSTNIAKTAADALTTVNAQISGITGAIKDIADQVSLLALNAAIEAARAGEAGRGFAVVAEEIRKLAGEARIAAEKVEELVTSTEDKTKQAINAIVDVGKNIDTGSITISEALGKVPSISMDIEKMASLSSSLKSRLSEIEDATKKVDENIGNLAAISEETAASSEEITSAVEEQTAAIDRLAGMAQELAEVASQLKSTISRFKL